MKVTTPSSLCDIGLPGLSGYDVARQANGAQRPGIVLAVTGCATEYDRRMAHEAGFDGAYEPSKYLSLDGYAADLVDLVRTFELANCTMVGHSVSAMIAMMAAIAAPDAISTLVMLSPSPCYLDDPATGYRGGCQPWQIDQSLDMMQVGSGVWPSYLASLVIDETHPAQRKEVEQLFCATSQHVARDFAEATFRSDCRSLLPDCPAQTLVLECSDDPMAPKGVAQYVTTNLPSAVHHQLETRGHCPHLTAPQDTAQAIVAFLKER